MTSYEHLTGYADYDDTTDDLSFTDLVDLADRRLGAGVIAANDELFAERENLLLPAPAVFQPHTFGPKGQLMDGWETRRRRGADTARPHPTADDHDWVLIRLGLPGVIRGIVVDTAHFRGNYPQQISVEAVELPGTPGPAELLAADTPWREIVPRSAVRGHAANGFTVTDQGRWTHLRLKQYPDGGIARLRVHGESRPDQGWLAALDTFDLAALEYGGSVEDASDRFFSPPVNLILPGRSREMGEGWENRRRRDGGHDWVRLRLAGRGVVRAVEIDTANYVGNAAGWAALSGFDASSGADPADPAAAGDWFELVPRTRLSPDSVHRFVLDGAARPLTHARLDVFPDGGIARLRLHGSLVR
ncbi:allantoicase [Kitasatospora sp. MAA4]|uniref:allantoicase n=1 Tax=Kitasatospora sp. MAA4 TaxID=3035093 RepID=UPI0024740255|nr:allantoicase [Kitasatospora sp. MAA4]MDH6137377.1 allantoicase [Kitasatospora sp. MAA4]